jgi:hypothetical protein
MMWEKDRNLVGNSGVMRALMTGGDAASAAKTGLSDFLAVRQRYLIYR